MCLLALPWLLRQGAEASQTAALAPHVPGELLVKFRDEAPQIDRLATRETVAATKRRSFDSGAEHWRLGPSVSVESAIEALRDNPLVEYAEPNSLGEFHLVPLDPNYLLDQWAPKPNRLNAEAAWDRTTGSSAVVVAVLDTGIDFDDGDLAGNKWVNTAEVFGVPGVDDDLNGYVDDKNGWDFNVGDNNPFPDTNVHGTNIAGVIGAHGSVTSGGSEGTAGLNWTIRLMNLKLADLAGQLTEAKATAAVDYARKNGAHIINASWAMDHCTQPCNQTLKAAMKLAGDHEVLVVASAGNDGLNIDIPAATRNPASFDLQNVVTVAASDPNDERAIWSGGQSSAWGPVSVDVAAPGKEILTTTTDFESNPGMDENHLAWFGGSPSEGGTSSAAPHVAGVAALLKSISLNIPFELLRARILDPSNLDDIPAFDQAGLTPIVTGGRVNAEKVINDEETVAPAPVSTVWNTNTGRTTLTLNWYATGDDGATGNASLHKARHSTSPITESNWLKAKLSGTATTIVAPGATLSVPVAGLAPGTPYYFKVKGYDEWGNGPISTNAALIYTCGSVCTISWCQAPEIRCNYSGTCPGGTCCMYQCVEDESCTQPDNCPSNACSCY